MSTNNKEDRARRLHGLISDAYTIAENSFRHARKLTEDGKTTKLGAWMYAAEKAIGEIVRLNGLLLPIETYESHYTVEFMEPPKKEPEIDA